ncbi:MAG TPA: NUDIX hydrolase [Gaiellaceae bacterium]|nr:NUDIX hydrolase [Gaiellaceae bacterium]
MRAAGGVVHRRGGDGVVEVLLVRRPRYGDWALPRGKRLPGETDEACTLREVEEETGLRCELGRELPSGRHRDREGRSKVVRYRSMRPLRGTFAPGAEVDDVRWLPLPDAAETLTYESEREVLRDFADGR